MAKIYVASSWRNEPYPAVVNALKSAGHEVYDFRNPHDPYTGKPMATGFSWAQIDPLWEKWTARSYREALNHPIAQNGFESDMQGLDWADVVVMVQPCGRSAAWELGYATGQSKTTIVLLAEGVEPELMFSQSSMVVNVTELITLLRDLELGA